MDDPESAWWEDRGNLAALAAWMLHANPDAGSSIVEMIEKPWNFDDEYDEYLEACKAMDEGVGF